MMHLPAHDPFCPRSVANLRQVATPFSGNAPSRGSLVAGAAFLAVALLSSACLAETEVDINSALDADLLVDFGNLEEGQPAASTAPVAAALDAALTGVPFSAEFPFPAVELRQGDTVLLIALPHAEKGFYRESRFEHSGMIYTLKNGDFTLFGPWRNGFKPGGLDAVTGTAGEFGMRANASHAEAMVGELFLKIGVGWLRKSDDAPYRFTKKYEVMDPGSWVVSVGPSFYEATQTVPEHRGRAYTFTKRIELPDPLSLLITYRLTNKGIEPINTTYYAHNLFNFNDSWVGPGDRIELLADLATARLRSGLKLLPRTFQFETEIERNRGYWMELPMNGGLANHPFARVTSATTGASVTVIGDYSPSKFDFYAHDKALCIEPFIDLNLDAEETTQWSDRYILALPTKNEGP